MPDFPEFPGTPVVLVHGLMGSPGNFERTARALVARRIPVVAPAYGRRGTVSLDDSLTELIDALPPAAPLDIVGHSLGALLGLRIAHRFPGKVRTLVGLGATFRGLPTPPNQLFSLSARAFLGRGATELMRPIEATEPAGTRVVSIISDRDHYVPRSSSELGEIINVHGIRHEYLPGLADETIQALRWTP